MWSMCGRTVNIRIFHSLHCLAANTNGYGKNTLKRLTYSETCTVIAGLLTVHVCSSEMTFLLLISMVITANLKVMSYFHIKNGACSFYIVNCRQNSFVIFITLDEHSDFYKNEFTNITGSFPQISARAMYCMGAKRISLFNV